MSNIELGSFWTKHFSRLGLTHLAQEIEAGEPIPQERLIAAAACPPAALQKLLEIYFNAHRKERLATELIRPAFSFALEEIPESKIPAQVSEVIACLIELQSANKSLEKPRDLVLNFGISAQKLCDIRTLTEALSQVHKVANEVGINTEIVLCLGDDFSDALTSSSTETAGSPTNREPIAFTCKTSIAKMVSAKSIELLAKLSSTAKVDLWPGSASAKSKKSSTYPRGYACGFFDPASLPRLKSRLSRDEANFASGSLGIAPTKWLLTHRCSDQGPITTIEQLSQYLADASLSGLHPEHISIEILPSTSTQDVTTGNLNAKQLLTSLALARLCLPFKTSLCLSSDAVGFKLSLISLDFGGSHLGTSGLRLKLEDTSSKQTRERIEKFWREYGEMTAALRRHGLA